MQWMCRSSTSTPPPDKQPGTTSGHEHHELETPGPLAGAAPPPPPPLLPQQAPFCHLRHRKRCALRDDVVESDLGHYDHLLRNHGVEWPEHFHQLVHCLRHRSVEDLHHQSDVGHLLHGVPLDPLLRPWRLCQVGSSYRLKSTG